MAAIDLRVNMVGLVAVRWIKSTCLVLVNECVRGVTLSCAETMCADRAIQGKRMKSRLGAQ
jgi:hypothetical protein